MNVDLDGKLDSYNILRQSAAAESTAADAAALEPAAHAADAAAESAATDAPAADADASADATADASESAGADVRSQLRTSTAPAARKKSKKRRCSSPPDEEEGCSLHYKMRIEVDRNPTPKDIDRVIKCANGDAVSEAKAACQGRRVPLPSDLRENWVQHGFSIMRCKRPGQGGQDFHHLLLLVHLLNDSKLYSQCDFYDYKEFGNRSATLVSKRGWEALEKVLSKVSAPLAPISIHGRTNSRHLVHSHARQRSLHSLS